MPAQAQDAALAKDKDRAGQHVEADHIAGRTADGNQPAVHRMANFVADVAVDQDGAARHSLRGPAISRADQMAGIAVNVDQSAAHFGTNPAFGVSLDVNLTAEHLATDVPTAGTVQVNLPTLHVSADPMDAGEIPLEVEPLVAGVARHAKHLGERHFAIAVKDLEPLDFGQRFVAGPIGRETLHFDGDLGFTEVIQYKSHEQMQPEGWI